MFIFFILFLYSLFIIENLIYFIALYILIVCTRYTFIALYEQGHIVKQYLLNVLTLYKYI